MDCLIFGAYGALISVRENTSEYDHSYGWTFIFGMRRRGTVTKNVLEQNTKCINEKLEKIHIETVFHKKAHCLFQQTEVNSGYFQRMKKKVIFCV